VLPASLLPAKQGSREAALKDINKRNKNNLEVTY